MSRSRSVTRETTRFSERFVVRPTSRCQRCIRISQHGQKDGRRVYNGRGRGDRIGGVCQKVSALNNLCRLARLMFCSLRIAEDLCRKRKPKQALPYLFKAMEDPNNLDAIIQMAFLMPTINEGVQLLEEGAARGAVSPYGARWKYDSSSVRPRASDTSIRTRLF